MNYINIYFKLLVGRISHHLPPCHYAKLTSSCCFLTFRVTLQTRVVSISSSNSWLENYSYILKSITLITRSLFLFTPRSDSSLGPRPCSYTDDTTLITWGWNGGSHRPPEHKLLIPGGLFIACCWLFGLIWVVDDRIFPSRVSPLLCLHSAVSVQDGTDSWIRAKLASDVCCVVLSMIITLHQSIVVKRSVHLLARCCVVKPDLPTVQLLLYRMNDWRGLQGRPYMLPVSLAAVSSCRVNPSAKTCDTNQVCVTTLKHL